MSDSSLDNEGEGKLNTSPSGVEGQASFGIMTKNDVTIQLSVTGRGIGTDHSRLVAMIGMQEKSPA